MRTISMKQAAQAMGGELLRTGGDTNIHGVHHDSRECGQGDLFVCIKGPNRDGHQFIAEVIRQGCNMVLISDETALTAEMEVTAILVENTVKALGKLAKYYLNLLDPLRVAVTGSVGKTSTRDMIYYVLQEKYRCGRNLKNYNNHIGLPISILNLEADCDAVVLEMGMSDFGEIDYLAEMVQPQIGVITNIGVAHMQNLGSREGIFRAKMELTQHLRSGKAPATMIFVYDEEFLNPENTRGSYDSLFIGTDGRSDFILSQIEDHGIDGVSFQLERGGRNELLRIPAPGRHNAFNAAAAAGVATLAGLTVEEIRRGLEKVQLTGSRLRVMRSHGLTVIDDTYNASPDSMKAALKVLQRSACQGRRVAILGEMYELGDTAEALHYSVGVFARSCGIDTLIAIGASAEQIAAGCRGGSTRTAYFSSKEKFLDQWETFLGEGDLVLVKASRGMKMETIVEAITK